MVIDEQAAAVGSQIAQEARSILPFEIRERSGRVLYSPVRTLLRNSSPIYFLGIYPGFVDGDPQDHNNRIIHQDLVRLERNEIAECAFLDERWGGADVPGQAKLQRRAQKVFSILAGGDSAGERLLRDTPASNVILIRKKPENEPLLRSKGNYLLESCWRFHEAVITVKKPTLVLTYAVMYAQKLAKLLQLGEPKVRDSGLRALPNLYAWELNGGVKLLAIPSLSQYDPHSHRENALRSFFSEFVPQGIRTSLY
jgi:hypothetical protein